MTEYAAAWKEKLKERVDPDMGKTVDIFESEIALKKQGKIDDKLFAETRLRLGLYGQRYDNGQRFDGEEVQKLSFPQQLTKGPETEWDAPGMVRIKIPYGGVCPEQLEVMAELSEEYSDGVSHITTRQDIQLHFVHIDNTPMLMRRLAAVGITTKEACGNSVRNVTACQIAGVCKDEAFDVTPYATALFRFLLGHPDAQDFGRKFKIAFSGCADKPCALTNLHDMGLIAKVENGKRGFKIVVGGGLGAVPHEAKTLYDFVPEEELLPVSQAVCRLFGRHGEKAKRAMARIKFLVAKMGIEEFRKLTDEERKVLRDDPRWTDYIKEVKDSWTPTKDGVALEASTSPDYQAWAKTNVLDQRQANYATVLVSVPLGDLSADQMRGLAALARQHGGDNVRFSIEQNVVFRGISCADLPEFYEEIKKLGLDEANAGSIVDITACPGTDTCKLGTSSSRGLAMELRNRLMDKIGDLDPEVQKLKIKASGCFNSCGQHHVAQLGFYGVSRKKDGNAVPHFQVVLGGRWSQDDGSYGLPIAAIPSKNVPAFIDRISNVYVEGRQNGENFSDFIARLGKKESRAIIEEFMDIPSLEEKPDYYYDWGDPRRYTTGDKGVGECAGEIVSLFEFDIAKAERESFDGQIAMEEEDYSGAMKLACQSMVSGAKALVKIEYRDVLDQSDAIAKEFKTRFVDTGMYEDTHRSLISDYLFNSLKGIPDAPSADDARKALQEAYLFNDKVHACYEKISNQEQEAKA